VRIGRLAFDTAICRKDPPPLISMTTEDHRGCCYLWVGYLERLKDRDWLQASRQKPGDCGDVGVPIPVLLGPLRLSLARNELGKWRAITWT
jgi:hypothetical protein